MNWLQKLCQKAYVDIGHGYSNPDAIQQETGIHNTIMWWYRDGRIFSKEAQLGKTHGDVGENISAWQGSGRIEFDKSLGSISFLGGRDSDVHKKVINAVISEFPGIKFYVFGVKNRWWSVQEYWDWLTK